MRADLWRNFSGPIIFLLLSIPGGVQWVHRTAKWVPATPKWGNRVAVNRRSDKGNVRHATFYGSHDLSLDGKHRLSIPSEVRRSINIERDGESFFVTIGVNKRPWIYTEKYFVELGNQPAEIFPGDDDLAFNHLWYGTTTRVILDTQGRILLPERILKRTGIDDAKAITLVGCGDHLEVWLRDAWLEREAELDLQRDELTKRLKETKLAKTPTPPADQTLRN
jgi:division/cell wall cluster transcriptional repressor MraZ